MYQLNPKKILHNTAFSVSSTTIHCQSLPLLKKDYVYDNDDVKNGNSHIVIIIIMSIILIIINVNNVNDDDNDDDDDTGRLDLYITPAML